MNLPRGLPSGLKRWTLGCYPATVAVQVVDSTITLEVTVSSHCTFVTGAKVGGATAGASPVGSSTVGVSPVGGTALAGAVARAGAPPVATAVVGSNGGAASVEQPKGMASDGAASGGLPSDAAGVSPPLGEISKVPGTLRSPLALFAFGENASVPATNMAPMTVRSSASRS